MEDLLFVINITLWVLLGIIPSLWIVKYDTGNVTIEDLAMSLLFGSLLGPIWSLLILITSNFSNKKIF